MEYSLSKITNSRDIKKMEVLLEKEGIMKDPLLDYSIGIFDEDYNLVATGSSYKNTLRCMAVDSNHQGEGLLNQIVTALIEHQSEIGNHDLFLYTKVTSAKFFGDLGFTELARVSDKLVFMENKKENFSNYLNGLYKYKKDGINGAIVMNANPFTKGHRYLVDKAIAQVDNLFIFVVSNDVSEFSFETRFNLVMEGVKDLPNVSVIPSGDYIISEATFPSYFLKDDDVISKVHGELDASIFCKIAKALDVKKRFVGSEPFSKTTRIYNEALSTILPQHEIELIEIPRLESSGKIISATNVRQALKDKDDKLLREFLPETTYTNLVIKDLL